ncbi:hypothetical protein PsorP6_007433 [Peronosclerospora sorghi]|uniref:Uncharacterized protein n=1 Tax=Peronosclerospora sorghi TaxID=230839 RepID=A0ACC0W8D0_9STRA|nr:hypothetical protein PsorP6_007433 [Peronosclerospora sorghi]
MDKSLMKEEKEEKPTKEPPSTGRCNFSRNGMKTKNSSNVAATAPLRLFSLNNLSNFEEEISTTSSSNKSLEPSRPDKLGATQTPSSRSPAPTTASTPRRPPPPRLLVPNDSLFTASYLLIADSSSTNDERYFKASSQLPTPVSAADCTRMWIPAAKLATEHSIDEILQSLAGDAQPETWRTHKASLQDFVRLPNQGISFHCTSDAALYLLGGLNLIIVG